MLLNALVLEKYGAAPGARRISFASHSCVPLLRCLPVH